jgi:hypothetical protein
MRISVSGFTLAMATAVSIGVAHADGETIAVFTNP